MIEKYIIIVCGGLSQVIVAADPADGTMKRDETMRFEYDLCFNNIGPTIYNASDGLGYNLDLGYNMQWLITTIRYNTIYSTIIGMNRYIDSDEQI